MSMSLIVWKSPVVTEPEEAKTLVQRYDEGEEEVFAPSEDVPRFFAELMRLYPGHEAFTEEELQAGATGWADSPEASDRVVWLTIRWSAPDELLETIEDLAREHELVLYDPQGPAVYPPGAEEVVYVPSFGEFVQATVAGTFGALLAVGAWIVSIPVLSWVLIAVGGFMAVMAVYTWVVLTPMAWRTWRAPPPTR